MATVTTTLASSGKTLSLYSLNVNYANALGTIALYQDPVINVYQVSIELSASECSQASFGGLATAAFQYPPYATCSPVQTTMGTGLSDDHSSQITAAKLTGIPGKAVLSANSLDALVYDDGSGFIGINASTTSPGDVGCHANFYWKYTGVTTNAYGYPAPTYDVYVFFVNVDPMDNAATVAAALFVPFGTVSIGITDSTLSAIFGTECMGIHLQWKNGETGLSGDQFDVVPCFKTSLNKIKHNAIVRSGIRRPPTFGTASHLQSTWGTIACAGGAAISQTLRTPVSCRILQDYVAGGSASRWVIGGELTQYVFVNFGPTFAADCTWYAKYYNAIGKLVNPGGTPLTVTVHPGVSDGPLECFLTATDTPPASAVSVALVVEENAYPGIFSSGYRGYYSRPLPPHWASEQGTFVPGNLYETTITESDLP